MRIDAHTHVFTLQSILTREAIRVITNRLQARGLPPFLTEAIGDALDEQAARPHFLDERRLLRALIRKMTGIDSFNDLVERHFSNDILKVHLENDLDDLSADALSQLIERVTAQYEGGGFVDTVLDVIATLRQATRPSITAIADDLLDCMDADGVIVALMIDMYGAPDSHREGRCYDMQIDGTAEAALQRPGRVLPFFGVHPGRPDHLARLKEAVEKKGFVGVKLYPSLDHAVDSPEMRRVYQYCVQQELPVLLHCGHGGFFKTEAAKAQCDPAQWTQVLADFPGLRVCFAHFGGWEALGKRHCLGENWDPDPNADGDPAGNWGKKIYDFMLQYPNVYTDLAKHVSMFDGGRFQRTYFDTMGEIIADPAIGPRILLGTDAWLLRLDMPFEDYWTKWRSAAAASWDAITIDGPRAFLGFPGPGRRQRAGNLERFARWMRENRHRVGQPPAKWLEEAIVEPFSTGREPPDWDFRKEAVRRTYQFFGNLLTDAQLARDHVANRLIRLRELPYWDRADPNFHGRCRDLARRFVDFADQGHPYAGGHTFGSVVDHFIDILEDGELRLCDVARALDTVMDFPESIA